MYKIKQLDWEMLDDNRLWRAELPLGEDRYNIVQETGVVEGEFVCTFVASSAWGWVSLFSSLADAKDACQLQFESWIRRFLEPA